MGDDYTADTLTTGVIASGGELKGAVDYNSDKDWIKTQLTAGVLYKFDLLGSQSSGGTLSDPYLRLLDSRGYSIESAYNGGAADDPNIGFIPTASGTYYLEASSFYSGKTGSYTVRVNSAGTFTINSATSQVNEGSTVTFNLTMTNVTSGTSLNYEISGVTASDISRSNLSGTVTVGPDGKATISIPIAADNLTEGDEILTVTAQGKSASTTIKDTSQSVPTTSKNSLTVLVNKEVLGPNPVILKDLVEEITSNGSTVTSHLIIYNGVKFNYADVDALITTVVRNGNFTDEFRNEILDLAPNLKDVKYEDLVKLVGVGNIDDVILNVAGADGNFVG
jgi:hypothetical protein